MCAFPASSSLLCVSFLCLAAFRGVFPLFFGTNKRKNARPQTQVLVLTKASPCADRHFCLSRQTLVPDCTAASLCRLCFVPLCMNLLSANLTFPKVWADAFRSVGIRAPKCGLAFAQVWACVCSSVGLGLIKCGLTFLSR